MLGTDDVCGALKVCACEASYYVTAASDPPAIVTAMPCLYMHSDWIQGEQNLSEMPLEWKGCCSRSFSVSLCCLLLAVGYPAIVAIMPCLYMHSDWVHGG